ncbi:DUF1737 domain-containing protein [Sulfuricurvum sp.]|uniref:DUF1737 domain-containing protein n=1 Tax=Sulfuricurvum sp. TaxID=2025608 RepID=UPI002608EE42|nr:DUF1737 domain-containing protein [Sulfuricurvum sp.]MDD2267635.1 DUF1737 domain-containing protein [Sulfuricurvum sp.]MDD2784973.1 DUF1737 domain-containing protein [Sulfuricurvum sp.]
MKKYIIVTAKDKKTLEDEVCKRIEDGYEPTGGLAITVGRDIVFSQAMWIVPFVNVTYPQKIKIDIPNTVED